MKSQLPPIDTQAAADPEGAPPGTPAPALTGEAPEQKDPLVGQIIADRYRVEALLGMGGMGAVYRATHVHMRNSVALKVLHQEMTFLPEVVARFEREAIAAGRIDHPNVAGAKDFGRLEDGSFYLVLEYVEGKSLREVLNKEKVLPTHRALRITRQVASALAAAHQAGIIHRDLKPENVMLVDRVDQRDRVKVLDFGIAKLSASDTSDQPVLTRLGSVFGTPEYMSPEQALGQTVDPRADLYSVGILLYEMLSGDTPFSGDEMLVILTKQMVEPPPPLASTVPEEIRALVEMLLAKDPDARPPTGDDLVQRVDLLLATMASSSGSGPQSIAGAVADEPQPSQQVSLGFTDTILHTSPSPTQPVAAVTMPGAGVRSALVGHWQRHWPAVISTARTEKLLRSLNNTLRIGPLGQVPRWAILGLVANLSTVLMVALALPKASSAPGPTSGAPSASQSVGVQNTSPSPATQPSAEVKPIVEASPQTLRLAAQGDARALETIQKKADSTRTLKEWRALGIGLANAKHWADALETFRDALPSHPALETDRAVIAVLRDLALQPKQQSATLDLLASLSGSSSVDLIYDLWQISQGQRARRGLAALAKKKLESQEVKKRASPALRILLDLDAAGSACEQIHAILPRAAENADRRAEPKLRALKREYRDCGGFFRRRDCYPCLRGDDALDRALRKAQETPGPSFGSQ